MNYNEHLTAGLAAAWNCTPNEAKSRVALKRKRTSDDSFREDIPWTAARCNRLLRTITSRINILRKQLKLGATPSIQCGFQDSQRAKQPEPGEETPPPVRRFGKLPPNDPEWVPCVRSKPSARTYAGKQKSHARSATKKADSGFSTPFIKRLLTTDGCSTVERSHDDSHWNPQAGRTKGKWQLPVQLGSSNEEAQRNLVTAFGGLLTATRESSTPERIGAPSLLNSCLRRVPAYIALEAEEIDTDDNDSEDVCSSIYAELENLGTSSGMGWPGLREVVRAHCLQHIQAAIEEGLLSETRVNEMISACSRNGALREADSLTQSWIERELVGSFGKLGDSHAALRRLSELRSTHHALEFYLRHHADLINRDRVWISDVLRPGSVPLKDMIKALVRGPGQDVALAYLEAAVLEDCAVPESTSLPIFTRLAGLLVSIALTQAREMESFLDLDVAAIVHRIAIRILQNRSGEKSKVIHPFVVASTLLHLAALPPTTLIVSAPISQLITKTIQQQSNFVKFTCNVVHHVFRFGSEDELRSLLLTTSGFLNPPAELEAGHRDSLSRVAFEIAFAYAEQTGVNIDQHFADGLAPADKRSASAVTQTPRRRIHVSGFKWEEGLCEWVAATPLTQKANESILSETGVATPRQLPTPKLDRSSRFSGNAALAVPSSPDIIAEVHLESPKQKHISRQTLQGGQAVLTERSTNARPMRLENKPAKSHTKAAKDYIQQLAPKQVHVKREKRNRTSQPIVPIEGKQVHLKVEKAKRAALLAEQASAAERKHLHSVPDKSEKDALSRWRPAREDTDELGIPTPAKKRPCRGSTSFSRSKSMSRPSLSQQAVDIDGMSDDELGL